MITVPSLESQLRSQESLLHSLSGHLEANPTNQRLLSHRRHTIEKISELRMQLPCQCGSGYSREQCRAGGTFCG
jgi:hypothetical protein